MKKVSLQTRLKLSQIAKQRYKSRAARKHLAEAQLKKLSPRDFNRIFKDKRPTDVIASSYSISASYVRLIKSGKRGQNHMK